MILYFVVHSVFNSYIFVTGRNDSEQKASDGINNFTVHYPHVFQQELKPFLFFISIAILFALTPYGKSNKRIFSLFLINYVCINYLPIRTQCDLENPINNLKICGKKYTAWTVSKYGVISGPNTGKYGPEITPYLDTFDPVILFFFSVNKNLRQHFILFTIYHSKRKN